MLVALTIGLLTLSTACASDDAVPSTATASPATNTPVATTSTSTPTPLPAAQTMTPVPTNTPVLQTNEPRGFPIDPQIRLGLVTGAVGSRTIAWGAGPTALVYSRDVQTGTDAVAANSSGWDCDTHFEYEGTGAVDWYVPAGTPVYATMPGTATLAVITVSNAFDYYGVSREPYIGNPNRSRAPLSPFPGPGGGKGVFVSVANEGFVTEYAHLELAPTLGALPASASVLVNGTPAQLETRFAPMRDFQSFTAIATWSVARGDLIGYTGDSGYSEAPHLHYTVRRQGGTLRCPTNEADFSDGGWLFR